MESINYVIVRADEAYINEVDGMIVNTTIESVSNINRIATVEAVPKSMVLQKGDKVIIHHNIMRLRNDTRGVTVDSNFHIEDDLYFVSHTEIFMYKRGDSDWMALDPYCFVEPIKHKYESNTLFEIPEDEISYKGYVKNKGVLKYPNQSLIDQGLKQGDIIIFSDYSEYEFNIGGKLYYKMATRDILMKE